MRIIVFLMIAFFVLQSTSSSCQDLDFAFNATGINQFAVGADLDKCNSMALDNNGNIILAGYSLTSTKYEYSIARLSSNGQLDVSLESDGKVVIPLGTSYSETATCMAVESSNKIFIAGYYSTLTDYELGIVKLNTDGTFDNSFDSDGKLLLQVTDKNDYATDISMQNSDNKIVVIGNSADSLFVIRLNTDGSIDNTFDSDGKLFFDNFEASALFIQADGKYLITGKYNNDLAVIKLNSNGSFDLTFDTDGIATIDFGSISDKGYDITTLASGKILVAGGDGIDFIAARLNTDGSLDNTFDVDGRITISFSNTDYCYSISEDITTNDILLAGYTYNLVKSSFAICRLSSNGSIEAKTVISVGSGNSQAKNVIVQSDRKVVVAGTSSNGTNDDFAVIRLLPDFETTEILSSEKILAGINLFPNPASHMVNIHSIHRIDKILITDILGNEIMKVAASGNTQIDITNLPKGLYTFNITTDKGTVNKKVSVY